MSTLADPAIQSRCCERLARIDPAKPPQWGRMHAHQMVCHLNDSFRVGMGERSASSVANLFTRTVMKWAALHTKVKWPKGVKTMPEVEQGIGGTPPVNWERDRAELRALILTFPKQKSFGPHPIFGRMTQREWMVWGYRHVDHHLRQFGV